MSNKGMTSVELIITFAILSLIVVGMFDIVLSYKDKEQKEAIESSIIDYENKLQKIIQDDLTKGHLINVQKSENISAANLNAKFDMNNPKTGKIYSTNMEINLNNGNITYGETGKEIVYSLPKFTNTLDDLTIDKDKTYIEVLGDDDAFVKINISLNCRDFEDKDLSFSITAPVAYPLS